MELKEYMAEHNYSLNDIARRLNINPNYVWCITNYKRTPSIKLAKEIEELTNGEVKALELRPDIKPQYCPECGRKKLSK